MEHTNNPLITVEVAYALPDEQIILSLEVAKDTTVEQAIKHSGILDRYPQIDLNTDKICKLNATLSAKDRIEIYRPLIADPKESRRQKAEMEKKEKKKTD